MKRLLTIIIGFIIAIVIFLTMAWKDLDLSLSVPSVVNTTSDNPAVSDTVSDEPKREFKFELPEAAFTEEGMVFSFQPYEIDCWAAGTYHFVVPYNKLMPYLTPGAKRLIDKVTF